MELAHLRALVMIASKRHFGQAATELGITQPALTQRIQALERGLGAQLMTRNARRVELTELGEELLLYASRLVEIEDEAKRRIADHVAGRGGRLRIAYLLDGDVPLQSSTVATFRRLFPGVTVEVSVATSETNLRALACRSIDAAFIELPAAIPIGISKYSSGRCYQLFLVLPASHHLSKQRFIRVDELRGAPLSLPTGTTNQAFVSALTRWFRRHLGDDLNVVAHEATDQAIEAVASGGLSCLAVVRCSPVRLQAKHVLFRPLKPAPVVQFALAYRSEDKSSILENLLNVLAQVESVTPLDAIRHGEPL